MNHDELHAKAKRFFGKCEKFASGDNCERGPAQRKAALGIGNFLGMVMGVAVIIGMVVAFGVWALAVVGLIVTVNVLTNRGS